MDAQYWQKKWSDDQIGFHQKSINSRLTRFWPELALEPGTPVFVPLCGKSSDMLWLHQQGFPVLGIELSEIAVRAFFTENELPFTEQQVAGFHRFEGTGDATGLELWAGDYFALKAADIARCGAFYDRASMIAMSPDMRARYASQLGALMRPGASGLLLTIAYDESQMNGPPFSVTDDNVQLLLGGDFGLTVLEHHSGSDRLGNLAERGLETLEERVYLLKRNP